MINIITYILNIFDKIYQRKIINTLNLIFNKNINIVFDVGAHKGEFIKLILDNFNFKKIYSFEPSIINFELLSQNIKKLNSKKKIFINNFALGVFEEEKNFKQMKESSSSTFNNINFDSKYFKRKNIFLNFGLNSKIFDNMKVKIKDGFSFVEKENINTIDLLKIDTEGYEYFVIKGFKENIRKIKVIFFEHHYNQMIIKNYTFSEIHSYLKSNNFKQHSKFKMPFRKAFEYIYVNGNYF